MYLLKDQEISVFVTNKYGAIGIINPLELSSREEAENLNTKLGGEYMVTTREAISNAIAEKRANAAKVDLTDEELDAFWARPLNVILTEAGLR